MAPARGCGHRENAGWVYATPARGGCEPPPGGAAVARLEVVARGRAEAGLGGGGRQPIRGRVVLARGVVQAEPLLLQGRQQRQHLR